MKTASRNALPPLELYQTEWCPASRRVRQRLTELDVAYVVRQVPVERGGRAELLARTGVDSIPVLIDGKGDAYVGEVEILSFLDARFEEPSGAEEHRLKAVKARKRELEEARRWLEAVTH